MKIPNSKAKLKQQILCMQDHVILCCMMVFDGKLFTIHFKSFMIKFFWVVSTFPFST